VNSDLTSEQRQILQLVYDRFRETGEWPLFQFVDRRADRDLDIDIAQVLPAIPKELIRSYRAGGVAFQPSDRIWLSVEGIACCSDAESDLARFLELLRWCAEREREFEPSTPGEVEELTVTAEDYADSGGSVQPLTALELTKLGTLLVTEPVAVWTTAGEAQTDHWRFTIGREIRRYRDVRDVDDYLRRRDGRDTAPTQQASDAGTAPQTVDFFISHASEDKEAAARPLYEELTMRGFSVWLDKAELTLGDSLRSKIDIGLRTCRFGVVILSPAFFAKQWPQYELDGLVARQMQGSKVILPVWHLVDYADVLQFSPSLAGYLSVSTADGISAVADAIVRAASPT
jgi:hypothetical protein